MQWVSWMKRQNKTRSVLHCCCGWRLMMDNAREKEMQEQNEWQPSKRRVNKAFSIYSVISCCAGHFPRGQLSSIPVGLPLDNMAHRNSTFIFRWSQDGIQYDCGFCTFVFLPCWLFVLKYLFYLFNCLMVDNFRVKARNRRVHLLLDWEYLLICHEQEGIW